MGLILYIYFAIFLAGSEIADQDSLDGQLPSNRQSSAANHLEASLPPPPAARPASPPSGGVNHEPQSFTKGPASKHKKHRRLNREQVNSTYDAIHKSLLNIIVAL